MKVLRTIAAVLGGLLALVLVAAALVVLNGWRLAHAKPSNRLRELAVAPDSSLVERGAHLARTSCAGCHSPNMQLPMSGSHGDFFAEPGMPPFGHLYGPNLTPAGRLAEYTDAELARAIREGLSREGTPLLVMPSMRFHALGDRDVAALVAYMRSQPAVESPARAKVLTPLAYFVLGAGIFPPSNMPEAPEGQEAPPEGVTPEYGEYVVNYLTCQDCHGEDLRGGRKGQLPPVGPDLVSLASAHSLEQFEAAMRQGRSALDGHSLDPMKMPYPVYANASDTEVAAIYALLKAGGIRPKAK